VCKFLIFVYFFKKDSQHNLHVCNFYSGMVAMERSRVGAFKVALVVRSRVGASINVAAAGLSPALVEYGFFFL
jgi:hypothetical protein